MTTLREAAQQALEALELAQLNGEAGLRDYEVLEIAESAVALRAALAEPVQEPVDVGNFEYRGNSVGYIYQKMTAYRNSIDAAWDALRAKGIHPDGKTRLAEAIARHTAPPQAVLQSQGIRSGDA